MEAGETEANAAAAAIYEPRGALTRKIPEQHASPDF